MKLNHDCIRDILLYVEKHCIYEENDRGYTSMHLVTDNELYDAPELSSKYDEDTITYTVAQLFLDNMIIGTHRERGTIFHMADCNIEALSPRGHEFLDNIKDDTVWKKAKKFVGEYLTSTSFSIIANVASKIAIEALANGATPK